MNSDDRLKTGKISLFTIIEIVILAFGVFLSLQSTFKIMAFTTRYAWCFAFAAVGVALIAVLIINIRRKKIWILGIFFIIFYVYFAGFGAFICEINASRLKIVNYYKEQGVSAEIVGVSYEWDRESVTYDPTNLEYLDPSIEPEQKIVIGDEERRVCVYKGPDPNAIYLEVYGGGTGIYLILTRK